MLVVVSEESAGLKIRTLFLLLFSCRKLFVIQDLISSVQFRREWITRFQLGVVFSKRRKPFGANKRVNRPTFPTAGRLEPPPASRSGTTATQARPAASTRGAPSPATLPPHNHPADAGLQEPQASQEAACGVLPGPHTPGSAHHHGKKMDSKLTVNFCSVPSVAEQFCLLAMSLCLLCYCTNCN